MTGPVRATTTRVGLALLASIALLAVLAPVLAPNDPAALWPDRESAPPTRVRLIHDGALRAPFVYRQVLENRLARRYREDRTEPVPIRWFRHGRLVSVDDGAGPLLLLGADALGRDVFARLLYGARLSLGVTVAGILGAIVLGALAGGLAGGLGGRSETVIMTVSDFVIVLPGTYLVLVLRGLLPPHLGTPAVFALMAVFFAIAGAPHVARGVRAIVATERTREYAEAARAAGAGPLRLVRHLLPAAYGFLGVQTMLLVPALLVAEVTVSFLGLGFPVPSASWGTMLQDSAHTSAMRSAPWLLAPAVALFVVVLAVQLAAGRRAETNVLETAGV